MTEDAGVDAVRRAIYNTIVTRAVAPTAGDVARTCGIAESEAADAFRALASAQVIVLRPGTLDLWSAPPFSAVPTRFRVRAGARSWSAPCAWDAFGIPAAMHADADIEGSCASTGEPIRCGVRGGRAFGGAVIHLLVPAARFWDDIFYT